MATPPDKTATTRRSFNASMERWQRERRGSEPDTIWGARALEALKPWEEGDLCLAHAVAIALETAYHEGKSGEKPQTTEALLAAAEPKDCEDCSVTPPKRVVRATAPAPVSTKPAPITRRGGTVAGYTKVIREMPTHRPFPATADTERARKHFENHPLAAPPKQDEYLEGIAAITRRRDAVVSKPKPIIARAKPAPIIRPIRK